MIPQDGKKQPDEIGAKPWHLKSAVNGAIPSQTGLFVLPTKDYIYTPWFDTHYALKTKAAEIVAAHKGTIKKWEIGNEWYKMGYIQGGCREARRYRYMQIAKAIATNIKNEDSSAEVYVTADWKYSSNDIPVMTTCYPNGVNDPSSAISYNISTSDFVYLKNQFGTLWDDIDGVSIHVYTGENPEDEYDDVTPPSISEVKNVIEAIRGDIGSDKKIIVTEWASSKDHNKTTQYGEGSKNLVAANHQIKLLYEMLLAGIDAAAYWPPAKAGNGISLLNFGLASATPLGLVFDWMSSHLKGQTVKVIANDGVTAAAAKYTDNSEDRLAIFLMGGPHENETVNIDLNQDFNGVTYDSIESVHAIYSNDDPNTDHTPDTNNSVVYSVTEQINNVPNKISLVINPGTSNRGVSHEIIKIVLKSST